jgi:hypothetical protein
MMEDAMGRRRGYCTLAAQPAEKSTFEQLGVETVGLRSPMLARHRHTRGVNDVGLT